MVAALKQAGAEVDAESAVRQQREARRARLNSAGMSGAASSLDALDDEASARRAALEKQSPQHGPEYEAGMQALHEHLQTQHSQITAKAAQLPEIAAHIYQHWGKGVAGNWITGEAPKEDDEYSPGAPLSSTHLAVLEQEAQKYGVSARDIRHHLEMQRLSDWSRASTSSANRQQVNPVDKLIRQASGRGPAEPARVLPNGSITVNPALGEDQATFDKAIQNTYSSPEAKEAARKMWPAYHDRWLNEATQTLKASKTLPGVQDYNEWLTSNQLAGHFSEKRPDGSVRPYTDNKKTQLYLDAMKARPGWRKLADNVSTSLTAGGGRVVSGVLGAEALARNSFQSLTGLDVGGQAYSDAAADMARQSQALTQSHELTGTIGGAGGRIISGVAQAVPAVGATVLSGGTAGAAAMGFIQGTGNTYTDLYQHHIDQGMTPQQAHRAAAGTAIATGAVSAALGRVFPGGSNALNNPAAREAAKKSFGTVVKSFLKGAADEVPQEMVDGAFSHIATEMNKGRTFQQAATSYAEQFRESAITSALLGGGIHAGASQHGGNAAPPPQAGKNIAPTGHVDPATPRPGQQTFSVASPDGPDVPSPQNGAQQQSRGAGVPITPTTMEGQVVSGQTSAQVQIPPSTTGNYSGYVQQLQIKANNGKPPRTSPAPAASLKEVGDVLDNIKRLNNKAQNGPLSLDEQRELDHNEKVLAQTRVKNLEKEQQVIRSLPQPRELDPVKTKALADAKAVLARPAHGDAQSAPTSSQPPIPEAAPRGDAGSSQQASTVGSNRQPSQTFPSALPVPTFNEAFEAGKTIDKLKAQKSPLSPEQQQELDGAEKVFARKTEYNILNQKAGIEKRGGKLHPTTAKALADAQAVLARPSPGGNTPPQHAAASGAEIGSASAKDGTADRIFSLRNPQSKESGVWSDHAGAQPPTQMGRTSLPQAALFDDVPGSSKTKEMRQKENEYLRDNADASSTRPSKQIFTGSLDAQDLAMQKAALLTDSVHDGLGMRPVLMGRNVSSWKHAGEYHPASHVQPAQINVSPDTGTPLLTSLHELGNHVDVHLDPTDVAAVVKAAEESGSAGYIRDHIDKNKDYHLSRDELWARAYAQYIALKRGDPEVLAELNNVLNNPKQSWKQWDKSDWIPIEEAITKALKRRTWR